MKRTHTHGRRASRAEEPLLIPTLVAACPNEKASPAHVVTLIFTAGINGHCTYVATVGLVVLEKNRVTGRDKVLWEHAHGDAWRVAHLARIIHDDSTQTCRSSCCEGRTALLEPAAYVQYASALRCGV
ncbi:MAG: hypothetical protein FWD69_19765, partial [Polyangiaceae bacterium]|nr:hypothetical protein [Polyangiaceae bacterium]